MIPIDKYVNIYSYAGGGSVVSEKQVYGRILTTNTLAPYGDVLEFPSAEAVRTYFGQTSKEYEFAQKYFGWTSKRMTQAKGLSFARYAPTGTPIEASIIGAALSFNIDTLKTITDGTLTLEYTTQDGVVQTQEFIGISFASATSMAEVASALNTIFTSASPAVITGGIEASYETLNGGRFVITKTEGYGKWQVATGDVAVALGLNYGNSPILSGGTSATNTMTDEMERIMDLSDNCYTFAFLDKQSLNILEEVAEWNMGRNYDFMFVTSAGTIDEIGTNQAALANFDGTWLQYDATANEMQYVAPMAATANINYSKDHAAISFMYQPFDGYTPSVTDGATAEKLDALNVNYIGQTGKNIAPFLQDGMLMGSVGDATVYVNGIWLKDQIITRVMELFMRADAIYANAADSAKIAAVCTSIWEQAQRNGVILVGKTLSSSEKAFIEQLTGDDMAWNSIVQQGYIFTYEITTDTTSGKRYFSFRLIYGACDTIRKVEGTNIAITTTA